MLCFVLNIMMSNNKIIKYNKYYRKYSTAHRKGNDDFVCYLTVF